MLHNHINAVSWTDGLRKTMPLSSTRSTGNSGKVIIGLWVSNLYLRRASQPRINISLPAFSSKGANKALHLTTIPLRSMAAGEIGRNGVRETLL